MKHMNIEENNLSMKRECGKTRNIKLFMGQIPSFMKEREIKLELSKYCQIEHVVVLREVITKKHKHCAFVYVSSEEDAQILIKEYNGKVILPGMNSPVTMEFSEKKNSKSTVNSIESSNLNRNNQSSNNPDFSNQVNSPSNTQFTPTSSSYPAFLPSVFTQTPNVMYIPIPSTQQPISVNSPSILSMTPLSSYYTPFSTTCSLVSDVFGYHTEGPKGANLFIYHLPTDVQEDFLFSLFSEYGTVVSTNIYRDRESNKSKGFGFVSMSSVEEADRAIQYLNGYAVRGKVLKVQRKKEK